MARSTWSLYQRALTSLEEFRKKFALAISFPVEPITLGLFLSHLHAQNYACSTMETYMSAIAYIHKLHGHPDPTTHFLVKKALLGARKLSTRSDVRLPITPPLLVKLISALAHCTKVLYDQVMFTSMFSLAFAAFLRVGELTVSNNNRNNVLQLGDVSFTASGGLQITFRNFKHSKGKSAVLEVPRRASNCPVEALHHYLALRGNNAGFLYVNVVGQPISREYFCKVLKTALIWCELDPSIYTSHSFRIGATCHAVSLGFSDAQIREMGRWHSDAFKRYIRLSR